MQNNCTNASECYCNYNKALSVRRNLSKDEIIDSAKLIAEKILGDDEQISRMNAKNINGQITVRFQAGKETSGCIGLYSDDTRIACFMNDKNEPETVLKADNLTGEIFVYDKNGELTQKYTKEEVEALKYYKYNPDEIHSINRYGSGIFSGSLKDEAVEMNNRLNALFADETKLFETKEDMTLYRALPDNLTEEDINALSSPGAVYTEQSFVSTTSDLDVAKRFQKNNPILKINVPKGSNYIDIEKLFNIDMTHWRENEMLFDKGSRFVVTGIDTENNIIEVDYAGKESE